MLRLRTSLKNACSRWGYLFLRLENFSSREFDRWRHFRTSGEIVVLLRSPDQETDALLLMSWESRPSSKSNVCESTRYQLVVTLLGRNRLILKMFFLLKVNSDSVRVGVLFSMVCWSCAEAVVAVFSLGVDLPPKNSSLPFERDEIWRFEGVGPMCLGQKKLCVWDFFFFK